MIRVSPLRCCSNRRLGRLIMAMLALPIVLGLVLGIGCVERGRYVAASHLRVAMQESTIASSAPSTTFDPVRFNIYKRTQQQLIQSTFVLTAALRKPEVAKLRSIQDVQKLDDPVQWLKARLRVTFPGDGEVMEVSIGRNDPEEAAILVRAVVDAYLSEVVNAERDQKRVRLSELDRAYVEKEQDVRERREDLKKLAETLGTSDNGALSIKQTIAMEKLAIQRKELCRLQSDLSRWQAELAAQQALLKGVDSLNVDDEVDLLAENDSIIRELQVELESHKGSSANAAEAKAVQGRIDAQRAKLVKLARAKIRSAAKTETRRLEPAIAKLNEQVQSLQKQDTVQQRELERWSATTVDFEMFRAEVQCLQAALDRIAAERENLRIEIRAVPRVTLLDRAEIPVD